MIGHPQPVAETRGWSNHLGALLRLLLSCFLISLLTGCLAKRSTYDVPSVPLSAQFKNQQTESSSEQPAALEKSLNSPSAAENSSLVEWWRYFGNRELEGLINRGMANNPDVRIATIRLAQAKARADQADAGLLPSLSVPATLARQAPGGTVGAVPTGSSARAPQTSIQSSLRGDFRLDIWGEQSALAESAQLQLWRAAFERDNVQRNVTATIASNYVEYVALNDRLRIASETERALSDTLHTVERRLALGDATVGDLEQQKAVVFGLRAAIPTMQQQREDAINTLAFMVGTLPGSLNLSEQGLETLAVPDVVPGLPSALLLRRPDVRMVEARLLSADADIDVARARILPPVDLSAQAGYSSNMLAQLFLPKAFFWSTVASLTASIFDAGKRANEKKYNEAMYEEMVETYIRTIYQAMREVEGSLATIRLAGKRLDAQREAAVAARRAWEINTKVYAMGGADHMSLLESERTFHRYQDDYQRAQMESFRGYISLFQALGGGVKPAAPLPGKGKRPETGVAAMVSAPAAVNAPAKVFSVDGVDLSGSASGTAGSQIDNFWQIELPGLYHRATVGAAWRDLRERYPQFMEGRMVRPRLSGRIEEGAGGQEAWYRLFVAKFASQAEGQKFCDQLLANQERCQVVYSKPGEKPQPELTPSNQTAMAQPVVVDQEKISEITPPPLLEPPAVLLPTIGQKESVAAIPHPIRFSVQVGAFGRIENAALAFAEWQARGYEPYVSEIVDRQGNLRFAVRTGRFVDKRQAQQIVRSIQRQDGLPALLVPALLDAQGVLQTIDVSPLLLNPANPALDLPPSAELSANDVR